MSQGRRWTVATFSTVIAAALTWSACQWGFGLDVATAATVAALATGVVGTPMATWAAADRRLSTPVSVSSYGGGGDGALEIAKDLGPSRRVWNIPPRSRTFTGRDSMLLGLRNELDGGGPVVILALHGIGGVGKTSLAVEHAHRHAHDYDVAWWVNAERVDLIGEQIAALGLATGWVTVAMDTPSAAREVLRHLRESGGWLVIFDNVEGPEDVTSWLPQGSGHVLVTSRNPNWRQVATPVDVDVFTRDESIALLQRLAPTVGSVEADNIAETVGDLPLAVAQAGGVISETGMTAESYLREFKLHADQVMAQGKPPYYPTTLAATIRVSLERLGREDEAAVQLLRLCAMLAPEVVPMQILTATTDAPLPEPFASVATSPLSLHGTIGRISRFGLAKVSSTGLQIHRLTHAVIAGLLKNDVRASVQADAERLLAAAVPAHGTDPLSWPQWALYLPHLLAVDPARSDDSALRNIAAEASWYLMERGDLQAGRGLAEQLYQNWQTRLGANDPDTLRAAQLLAKAYRRLGRYEEAQILTRETLASQRWVLGPDHPNTLNSANDLALGLYWLGFPEQARALHQETLLRLRETLGEDQPLTLGVAHNLAVDLRAVGLREEALALNKDTFLRRRRVLGEDHPHTLLSAADLAHDLYASDRIDEALGLHRSTLTRRQRVLGQDHPHTLQSASDVAAVLQKIGEMDEAIALHADTLSRRERVLGPDHPHTLLSASGLASAMREAGQPGEAQAVEERIRPASTSEMRGRADEAAPGFSDVGG